MSVPVRLGLIGAAGLALLGLAHLWAARGSAILLDFAFVGCA